jgi:hypothetical protein
MRILPIFILALIAFACNPKSSSKASDASAADLDEISAVIHSFYSWYDGFVMDSTIRVDFTDASGEHLKLNEAKFKAYYAHFEKSGYVSAHFVTQELAFFKKCEAYWQNEHIEDVPSCLDADKYFCAQDWDIDYLRKAPISITEVVDGKTTATLDPQHEGEQALELKMIKENGKWVIAEVVCDMGVE